MARSNSLSDPTSGTGNVSEGVRLRGIRLVGLAIAALALIATTIWDIEKLRESVFDQYQRHTPRAVDIHYARIVRIDNESLKQYGPWPWSRHLLARLAAGIHARGARAIGFDMLFIDPDRHAPANISRIYPGLPDHVHKAIADQAHPDQTFEKTIARLPVVLGRSGHNDEEIDHERHPGKIPIEAGFKGHAPPPGLLSFGNAGPTCRNWTAQPPVTPYSTDRQTRTASCGGYL